MKKSQNILQQVNKNCYSLALQPDILNITIPYSHGCCRFSGNDGAVESNANLLGYYNRLFGSQFPNFLTPLGFRGVQNAGLFEENGLPLTGNKVFSNWLINKKVRVVKTTLEGSVFTADVSAAQDFSDMRPFESYPVDVWQGNGVGSLIKQLTVNLKVSAPVGLNVAGTEPTFNGGSMQKYESNEVYYLDNKSVMVVPVIAQAVPALIPFPPAIAVFSTITSGRYAFSSYYMLTLYFEVDEGVKEFDHTEIDLKQALAENKIIIEQNPDIFNPVYKPLTQTEKNNIIIIDNL